VTETEWSECVDPGLMLEFLRGDGQASHRKLRLFACACCRRVWHLLQEQPGRLAVEVAERFADGLADTDELAAALEGAGAVVDALFPGPPVPVRPEDYPAIHAAEAAQGAAEAEPYDDDGGDAFQAVASSSAYAIGTVGGVEKLDPTEQHIQAHFLRDLFGPLSPLPASLLAWRDGLVTALAQSVYDERLLPSGHLDPARLAV